MYQNLFPLRFDCTTKGVELGFFLPKPINERNCAASIRRHRIKVSKCVRLLWA
jgi:hypothetical protein